MNIYIALGLGCFVGVLIGFRAGAQFMFDKDGKEYLRGYKDGLTRAPRAPIRTAETTDAPE